MDMCGAFSFDIHRSQKDVRKRVAAYVHPANLYLLFRSDAIEVAGFDVFRKYELDAAAGKRCAFATEATDTDREFFCRAHCLEFHEAMVGAAFLFDVAQGRNATTLQDEDFVAGLIDVSQQMRGDQQTDTAFLANLLD